MEMITYFKLFFNALYCIIFLVLLLREKIIKPLNIIRKNREEKIYYYREELDEYSPIIYSKLLGKDIYSKDVITAMILYLRNKGWNEKNNEVYGSSNFLRHEEFFMKKSKFIFYDVYNKKNSKYKNDTTLKEYFEKLVEDDLKDEEILKKEYGKDRELIDLLPFLFFIINIIYLGNLAQNIDYKSLTTIKIIEAIVNIGWITIYLINNKFNLSFLSKLEEKGRKYLAKLKASKRYLKDFSLISDKKIQDEVIWNSYIRNTILFNLKGNLDKEATEYCENIISLYGYVGSNEYREKFINIFVYITVYVLWFFIFLVGDSMFKMILANCLVYPFIYVFFIGKNN